MIKKSRVHATHLGHCLLEKFLMSNCPLCKSYSHPILAMMKPFFMLTAKSLFLPFSVLYFPYIHKKTKKKKKEGKWCILWDFWQRFWVMDSFMNYSQLGHLEFLYFNLRGVLNLDVKRNSNIWKVKF